MQHLLKLSKILLSQHEWIMSIRRKVYLVKCLIETTDIPGDIVEIGCFKGLNSVLIQATLDLCESNKVLHLYDSFEGLPEFTDSDRSMALASHYQVGTFKAQESDVIENFRQHDLKEPVIHVGKIENTSTSDFPEKVSLAFIDLDFYRGTLDSLERVWPLMSENGLVILDDYGFRDLPGVEKAALQFFKDKATVETVVDSEITGIIRKIAKYL